MSKAKKFCIDYLLNIIATALPIALLQIIILPQTADRLGSEAYGTMVTVVSLFSIVSMPLGNALNNVRLIRQQEYENRNLIGDFNVLLLISSAFNAPIMAVMTILYSDYSFLQVSLTVLTSTICLFQAYLSVCFRLDLDYKSVLKNQLFLVIGYITGFILAELTGIWQWIYLFGYLCSLTHLLARGKSHKEPPKKTVLFATTRAMFFLFVAASLISSAATYADKLILHPLMGPAMVSVYYSATICGKMISMGIGPMSSVMLSYLAKMRSFGKKRFLYILGISCVVGTVGYFACLWISPYLISWLYPEWACKSIEIINYTTIAAMLELVSQTLRPIVLRFRNVSWQILMNSGKLIIYILAGFVLIPSYGIQGFCRGVICSGLFQLLSLIGIYCFTPEN